MREYRRRPYVRDEQRSRNQLKSYRAARRIQLETYKKSHPCERCGEADHRCLAFHHLRDKEYTISEMVTNGLAWDRILKEIGKCEVLCANCHAREHYPQGEA